MIGHMTRTRLTTCLLTVLLGLASVPSPGSAQAISLESRPWTGSVLVPAGGPIVPIFDGWYPNEDGTHTLCFGYYSTNYEENLEIPLGPNNFVEPAEYDGAQPDFFEHIPERPFSYRRRYCVFPVRVPADFGPDDRVTWTLRRGRGEALSVPGKLTPAYRLDELTSPGRGDIAPTLHLAGEAAEARGRSGVEWGPLTVAVGEPLELTVAVDHPEEDVWVGWARQQGPGPVVFSEQNTMVDPATRTATTTARFTTPGRYVIRVQSIDDPVEAFEFHCCWTNAFLEVTVQ